MILKQTLQRVPSWFSDQSFLSMALLALCKHVKLHLHFITYLSRSRCCMCCSSLIHKLARQITSLASLRTVVTTPPSHKRASLHSHHILFRSNLILASSSSTSPLPTDLLRAGLALAPPAKPSPAQGYCVSVGFISNHFTLKACTASGSLRKKAVRSKLLLPLNNVCSTLLALDNGISISLGRLSTSKRQLK